MDFWGFLYAELNKAAADMKHEDTKTWRELDMLAERAGWVFEDWRDFGTSDNLTRGSRKLYGKWKRVMGQVAQEITAEAEAEARHRVIASYIK